MRETTLIKLALSCVLLGTPLLMAVQEATLDPDDSADVSGNIDQVRQENRSTYLQTGQVTVLIPDKVGRGTENMTVIAWGDWESERLLVARKLRIIPRNQSVDSGDV